MTDHAKDSDQKVAAQPPAPDAPKPETEQNSTADNLRAASQVASIKDLKQVDAAMTGNWVALAMDGSATQQQVAPGSQTDTSSAVAKILAQGGSDSWDKVIAHLNADPSTAKGPWKEWAESGKALNNLVSGQTDADKLKAAVKTLTEQAAAGNAFGRSALINLLLVSSGKDATLAWISQGQQLRSEQPPHLADLSNLARTNPALLKELRQEVSSSLGSLSAAPLTRADASALVLGAVAATRDSDQKLHQTIVQILAQSAKEFPEQPAFKQGLTDSFAQTRPNSELLGDVYLGSAQLSDLRSDFSLFARLGYGGDKTGLSVLANITGNPRDLDLADRAALVLKTAASNPAQAATVSDILIRTYARNGDANHLLHTLGAIYANRPELPEQVRQTLHHGASSADATQENGRRQYQSALQGLMEVSPSWTQADLRLLAAQRSPEAASAFRVYEHLIPSEQQRQLLAQIRPDLDLNQNVPIAQRKHALDTLSAFAVHADRNDVLKLAGYGDGNGSNGGRLLIHSGLSKTEASQIQVEAAGALLNISQRAADRAIRQAAQETLLKHSWGEQISDPVRNELSSYAAGQPERIDLSQQAAKHAYTENVRAPLSEIFKRQGISGTDAEFEQAAKAAVTNHGEENVRAILDRVAMVNALPPNLRKELTGAEQTIDSRQVIGQMINGTLKDSRNAFLDTDLKAKFEQIRSDESKKAEQTNKELNDLNERKTQLAKELAEHTKEGVGFLDRLAFWQNNPEKFEKKQQELVRQIKEVERQIVEKTQAAQLATGRAQLLELSQKAGEHSRLMQEGKVLDADKKAMEIWGQYGNMTPPSVMRELTGPGAFGKNAFERLKEAGVAVSDKMPQLAAGTKEGFQQGLKTLTEIRGGSQSAAVDVPAIRQNALRAVDSAPEFGKLLEGSQKLATHLPVLQQMFTSGMEGTKYEEFVKDARSRAEEIDKALKDIEPHVQGIKDRIEDMKKVEATTQDEQTKKELQDRIKKLEDSVKFFDPQSAENKQFKHMIEMIRSSRFDENTFVNWLKRDGIIIGVAIVAAVATIATLGAAAPALVAAAGFTTWMGIGASLTIAAVGTAGGLVGQELAKEGLYHANNALGDVGLGQHEQSRVGAWITEKPVVDPITGEERQRTFMGDVLVPYTIDFAKGTAITFATMGIGHFLARGINAGLSRLGPTKAHEFLVRNSAELEQLGSRSRAVDQMIKEQGSKAFSKRFLESMRHELPDEFMDEAKEELAGDAVQKMVGQNNSFLGMLASAAVAGAKGVRFDSYHRGRQEITFTAETPAALNTLITQFKRDGHQVKEVNGQLEVKTPEGTVFKLRQISASEAEAADNAPSTTGSGDTRAEQTSTGTVTDPQTRLEFIPVGAGAEVGRARAETPTEQNGEAARERITPQVPNAADSLRDLPQQARNQQEFRQFNETLEARLKEAFPNDATQHKTDFDKLVGQLYQKLQAKPEEAAKVLSAVEKVLSAEKLAVGIDTQQRIGLAKQLLNEAVRPNIVDQGTDNTCGPAVVQEMALHDSPGSYTQALSSLIVTGKFTTDNPRRIVVDLSQDMLSHLPAEYRNVLQPDNQARRSLAEAAKPGADPLKDGERTYASQLGQLLAANIHSQNAEPGQRAIYAKGPRGEAVSGERLFAISDKTQFDMVVSSDGQPKIGPGIQSTDLQPIWQALTGGDTNKDFVLVNTSESITPGRGKAFQTSEQLNQMLLQGPGRYVVEVDPAHPLFNQGIESSPNTAGPSRHVVLVEVVRDQNSGEPVLDKATGTVMLNVYDQFGRTNDMSGEKAISAGKLFAATAFDRTRTREIGEGPFVDEAVRDQTFDAVDKAVTAATPALIASGMDAETIEAIRGRTLELILEEDLTADQFKELQEWSELISSELDSADKVAETFSYLSSIVVPDLEQTHKEARERRNQAKVESVEPPTPAHEYIAVPGSAAPGGHRPRRGPAAQHVFRDVDGNEYTGKTKEARERAKEKAENYEPGFARVIQGENTPDNFHQVSDSIFRGAAFTSDKHKNPEKGLAQIQELKDRGVTLIIDMQLNAVSTFNGKTEEEVAKELGITYVKIPVSGKGPTAQQIEQFMQLMAEHEGKGGVYMHCAHGRDRTGVMTAAWRIRTQGWDPDKAFREMTWMGHNPDTQPEFKHLLPTSMETEQWKATIPDITQPDLARLHKMGIFDAQQVRDQFELSKTLRPGTTLTEFVEDLESAFAAFPRPINSSELAERNLNRQEFSKLMHAMSLRPDRFAPHSSERYAWEQMLIAVGRRSKADLSELKEDSDSSARIAQVRQWLAAAKQLTNSEAANTALFRITGSLSSGDLAQLTSEESNQLWATVTEDRLSSLLPKEFHDISLVLLKNDTPPGLKQMLLLKMANNPDLLDLKLYSSADMEIIDRAIQQHIEQIENPEFYTFIEDLDFHATAEAIPKVVSQLAGNPLTAASLTEAVNQVPDNYRSRLKDVLQQHAQALEQGDDITSLTRQIEADFAVELVEHPLGNKYQPKESVRKTIEELVRSPLERSMAPILSQFPGAEGQLLLEAMKARPDYFSSYGMLKHFEQLAALVRSDSAFLVPNTGDKRGHKVDTVRALVVGDATAGGALAYLFRKPTGVEVDVHTLSRAPQGLSYDLPDGSKVQAKFLIRASKTEYVITDQGAFSIEQNGQGSPTLRPADLGNLLLFDKSTAETAELSRLVNVHQPKFIAEFHDGANLFDVMAAGAGNHQGLVSKLKADVAALRNQSRTTGTSVNRGQIVEQIQEILSGADEETKSKLSTKLLLYTISRPGIDYQGKLSNNVILDPRSAAFILRNGPTYLSGPEMINQARELHQKLTGKQEGIPEQFRFVSDADNGGSTHLINHLYRLANGLTDPKYDRFFVPVTAKTASALAGKTLIYLDDYSYSGRQTVDRAQKIAQKMQSSGQNSQVVVGTLGAYEKGIQHAKDSGVSLVTVKEYKDIRQQFHEDLEELKKQKENTIATLEKEQANEFVDRTKEIATLRRHIAAMSQIQANLNAVLAQAELAKNERAKKDAEFNEEAIATDKGGENDPLVSGIVSFYMVSNDNSAFINDGIVNFTGLRPRANSGVRIHGQFERTSSSLTGVYQSDLDSLESQLGSDYSAINPLLSPEARESFIRRSTRISEQLGLDRQASTAAAKLQVLSDFIRELPIAQLDLSLQPDSPQSKRITRKMVEDQKRNRVHPLFRDLSVVVEPDSSRSRGAYIKFVKGSNPVRVDYVEEAQASDGSISLKYVRHPNGKKPLVHDGANIKAQIVIPQSMLLAVSNPDTANEALAAIESSIYHQALMLDQMRQRGLELRKESAKYPNKSDREILDALIERDRQYVDVAAQSVELQIKHSLDEGVDASETVIDEPSLMSLLDRTEQLLATQERAPEIRWKDGLPNADAQEYLYIAMQEAVDVARQEGSASPAQLQKFQSIADQYYAQIDSEYQPILQKIRQHYLARIAQDEAAADDEPTSTPSPSQRIGEVGMIPPPVSYQFNSVRRRASEPGDLSPVDATGEQNVERDEEGYRVARQTQTIDWTKATKLDTGAHTVSSGIYEVSGDARVTVTGDAIVKVIGKGVVQASGNSIVYAQDNAEIYANEMADVYASGAASVKASGEAIVKAADRTRVDASGRVKVTASDTASVRARDASKVEAKDRVKVESDGTAEITAIDQVKVKAGGSSVVYSGGQTKVDASNQSRVFARDHSLVTSDGDADVNARGESHVDASGASHVYLSGTATATAKGTVSVNLTGRSHVTARGGTTVTAKEQSTVEAMDQAVVSAWSISSVVAFDNAQVVANDATTVELHDSAHADATSIARVTQHDQSTVTRGGQAKLTIPQLDPYQGRAQSAYSEDSPVIQVLRKNRQSVVQILTEKQGAGESSGGAGTGFFVTDRGELATALHVVADAKEGGIKIKLANGKVYKATVVAIDPSSDTALLQAEAGTPVTSVAELAESTESDTGIDVMILGHPDARSTLTASVGTSTGTKTFRDYAQNRDIRVGEDFDLARLNLTAKAHEGSSGSPVYSLSDGKVIGVATRGGSDAYSTLATRASHIRAMIASREANRQYDSSSNEPIVMPASRAAKGQSPVDNSSSDQSEGDELPPTVSANTDASTIVSGAHSFVQELTDRYPQVDEQGRLNYYLAGSLATTLMLSADRVRILDSQNLPQISSNTELTSNPNREQHLARFTRPIGDLDFVPLNHYRKAEHRLTKGGGNIQLDELSPQARSVLKTGTDQVALMGDPLSPAGGKHEVAVVTIGGRDYYIAAPNSMLSYKVIHIAEKFGLSDTKTDKLQGDFEALLSELDPIYGREALVKSAHQTLINYGTDMANGLYIPTFSPQFSGELQKFFDQVIASDPNSHYLSSLQHSQHRGIGVLKILHNLPNPEAKQAVIDFINSNRDLIDQWQIAGSENNRQLLADHIMSDPARLKAFAERTPIIRGELTRESVLTKLSQISLHNISEEFRQGLNLEQIPASSETLNLLLHVSTTNTANELKLFDRILQAGTDPWELSSLVQAEYMQDVSKRSEVLTALAALSSDLAKLPPHVRTNVLMDIAKGADPTETVTLYMRLATTAPRVAGSVQPIVNRVPTVSPDDTDDDIW